MVSTSYVQRALEQFASGYQYEWFLVHRQRRLIKRLCGARLPSIVRQTLHAAAKVNVAYVWKPHGVGVFQTTTVPSVLRAVIRYTVIYRRDLHSALLVYISSSRYVRVLERIPRLSAQSRRAVATGIQTPRSAPRLDRGGVQT